ncbi:L-serine ammonia-lyase [Rubripirellula sp.]|nr:L-serine ammonia-lyase [Rubripirellula sp.]
MIQRLSAFDMFKIGIGPSSSHTMGPWIAARRFVDELFMDEQFFDEQVFDELGSRAADVERVTVDLYGSLAKTGKGHGTDVAVQLGLCGYDPKTFDAGSIAPVLEQIAARKTIRVAESEVRFEAAKDIRFQVDQQLPEHPNGMRFIAALAGGERRQAVFYSVGGGFVVREGEDVSKRHRVDLPFPIDSSSDLLEHCDRESIGISDVVMRNERAWRSDEEIISGLGEIRETMMRCIHRGCLAEGTLPGGLNVQRRASRVAHELLGEACPLDVDVWQTKLTGQTHDFRRVLDWVTCFALAVNEENAAFGQVVTAPTNGAAGVVPAVLMYFECFCQPTSDAYLKFLLTAAEIGCIFKKGATISAAMGGCQAEIGVSSAMAAAALTEGLGGSPRQATMAAEIAMEHHLGLTCDPIGGLVQIPCIERNAFGAIKAITASQIALGRDPSDARVSLDAVVRTMWETAQDMNSKYKETSEGGLAIQVPVNISEC